MFYLYMKDALAFVTDIGKPELCFQWDPEVLDLSNRWNTMVMKRL